jgi:phosphoenolpyruvate carboxykinase (GTP)
MIDRIEGKAKGLENVFGISPSYGELNWNGLNFTAEQFHTVTHIDKAAWANRIGPARRVVPTTRPPPAS